MPDRLEVRAVHGIGEVRPGEDLGALICAAAPWVADGDVLVVTSKVVAKAEGRLVRTPTDPAGREAVRRAVIDGEAVRDVARHGLTRIVETRHGFVMAAAGVDASNVAGDEIALLPEDSDRSAMQLRTRVREIAGADVAVIVTDTMGRAWRNGLVDVAIGVSGLSALRDYRGQRDSHGYELAVTEVAEADELAGAADLVKGKLAGVPVAVVRGMPRSDDRRGVGPLVRPAQEDLFRLGTAEAMRSAVRGRRETAEFTDDAVDPAAVRDAVDSARTAPCSVQPPPWDFEVIDGAPVRVTARLRAPADPTTLLELGAALQNILVTASAHGLATRWDRSPSDGAGAGTVYIGHPLVVNGP